MTWLHPCLKGTQRSRHYSWLLYFIFITAPWGWGCVTGPKTGPNFHGKVENWTGVSQILVWHSNYYNTQTSGLAQCLLPWKNMHLQWYSQYFFYPCWVHQLSPYLSQWDWTTVIHAMVTSGLKYCNSLYVGLPLRLLWKLEVIYNVAAILLTNIL